MENVNDTKTPLTQSTTQDYGGTTLTIGDGKDEVGNADSAERELSIFPFEPFKWLPSSIVAVLPCPWTRIVSLPHLVLLIACLSSFAVLIETVAAWKAVGCRTYYCQGRITPVVFVAFCMMYFFRTLQQYDARLVQKQKELQVAKMELDERYKETIRDMEGFLAQSLETQVTFAERGFDSHHRDFNRFLEKYKEQLRDSAEGADAVDGASLPAFRSFVRRWLGYFSEASIDPVQHPLQVVAFDDMDGCRNRAEVATLVSERLASIEVQFVSTQREKDKEELSRVRSSWINKSTMQKKALAIKELLCGRVPVFHEKETDVEAAQPEVSALSFDSKLAKSNDAVDEYRWVQWGRSQSLGVKRDEDIQTTLPAELHLGCVTIVLLSPEHIQLIMAFFMGIAVLILECAIIKGIKYSMITETFICLICIVFILHEFLDIDIVQQLDAQLRALEAAQLEVLQKRERIMAFYTSTQELGDLWLHHTIPQLDLMKCFYDGLLDLPVEDHVDVINGMEQQLEALEQSIPPLEQWRGDSVISKKKKKSFSSTISEFVRKNRGIHEALALMPQCHRDIRIAFGLEVAETTAVAPEFTTSQVSTVNSTSPIKAGSAVEYFSKSRWRWIPARVLRVDPVTGLLDLDYKSQVDRKNVRPIAPEEVDSENQDSRCRQQ
jgi:hypothetical protein